MLIYLVTLRFWAGAPVNVATSRTVRVCAVNGRRAERAAWLLLADEYPNFVPQLARVRCLSTDCRLVLRFRRAMRRQWGPVFCQVPRRRGSGPDHKPCNRVSWLLSSAYDPREGTTRHGKGHRDGPRKRPRRRPRQPGRICLPSKVPSSSRYSSIGAPLGSRK